MDKILETRITNTKIKYGDNEWWKQDLKTMAYFQLQEPILIVPFATFHKGVEKLLNRSVFTHEFANPQSLIDEANKTDYIKDK